MPSAYPTFIGIGAQKAGTTWLYRNLQAHPDVWLPLEKELHYFDEKRGSRVPLPRRIFGETPVAARWRRQLRRRAGHARHGISVGDLRWAARYFFLPWNDAWYASLFAPGAGRTTGEVTPSYAILDSEQVASIRSLLPDTRIIFLMRNPIERAWSHAMMEVRNHAHATATFEFRRHFEAAASELRTNYVRTLDIWGEHYPAEQIFVGFLEDVHFHPEAFLGRVCEFLGLTSFDRWPHATSRVHGGSEASIPGELATSLAELHGGLTRELASRFHGHASWWSFCAERLAEERPVAGVPAPLYAGPLWTDWLAGRDNQVPPLQSAPLSS